MDTAPTDARFYAGIGSRKTPIEICKLMQRIAFSKCIEGIWLRSGAADHADSSFEAGAGMLKDIWLPKPGYKGRTFGRIFTHDGWEMARKYHPKWHRLTLYDKCLHARNSHIVLGENLDRPVEDVICWTEDGTAMGGTGQALRIAEDYNIPVHNLHNEVWRNFYTDLTKG